MKLKIITAIIFTFSICASAINGYGIEGNLVTGLNGKEVVYMPSINGRVILSDYFSTSLGIGLLNSGVKKEWTDETETSTTFTSYRLSSTKITPTLNLGFRGQLPLFEAFGRQIFLYAEPGLIYVPFSARDIDLHEFGFEKKTSPIDGTVTYKQVGDPELNSITSPCHQNIYGSISAGFSFEIKENVDFSIGYGYNNIDVFKYVRNMSINGMELRNHIPGSGVQFLNIGVRVNYKL